jgi:ribonuclease HI
MILHGWSTPIVSYMIVANREIIDFLDLLILCSTIFCLVNNIIFSDVFIFKNSSIDNVGNLFYDVLIRLQNHIVQPTQKMHINTKVKIYTHSPNVVAAGWCIRNDAGSFVAAGSSCCRSLVTVPEGEAMALLEALRETIARGWSNVIFESDSKIVVNAVHSNHQGNSEGSSIISSIKLLLHSHSNFEVRFTKRQADMAAHSLARAACS